MKEKSTQYIQQLCLLRRFSLGSGNHLLSQNFLNNTNVARLGLYNSFKILNARSNFAHLGFVKFGRRFYLLFDVEACANVYYDMRRTRQSPTNVEGIGKWDEDGAIVPKSR